MTEDPAVETWRQATTEKALAAVTSLRTDPGVRADRDELRHRIRTAAKHAEALICECVRRPPVTGPVLRLCDRCQLLGILTGSGA